jgi:hypothetical protein
MTRMLKLFKGKLFSYLVAINKGMLFDDARYYAKNALQGSRAVPDVDVNSTVIQAIATYANLPVTSEHLDTFVHSFKSWTGLCLDNFDADYSAGCTQSFDSFYLRHRDKKFRCLVGEYFYHLKTWESNNINWSFIDADNPLQTGDALVISYPFCDTGNFFNTSILEECCAKDIPVLIDMCYYPLTSGCAFDFDYQCIDTVAFSLSKVFPVANYRIGVRYTRKDIHDGQKLHHSINYNNMLSAFIGSKLIEKYNVTHIYNTYNSKQKEACEFLNLTPSDSVLFAVGDEDWNTYSRHNLLDAYQLDFDAKMFCNRICLIPVYEHWNLFERFKHGYIT